MLKRLAYKQGYEESPFSRNTEFFTNVKPIFFDKYYYTEGETRLAKGGGKVVREFSKPQHIPQPTVNHYGLKEITPKKPVLQKAKSEIELYGEDFSKSAPLLPKL